MRVRRSGPGLRRRVAAEALVGALSSDQGPALDHGAGADAQGRFIWQLVGVLDTKGSKVRTGTSVMPVFSGL